MAGVPTPASFLRLHRHHCRCPHDPPPTATTHHRHQPAIETATATICPIIVTAARRHGVFAISVGTMLLVLLLSMWSGVHATPSHVRCVCVCARVHVCPAFVASAWRLSPLFFLCCGFFLVFVSLCPLLAGCEGWARDGRGGGAHGPLQTSNLTDFFPHGVISCQSLGFGDSSCGKCPVVRTLTG